MNKRPDLGTLAWAEITHGRLSRADRRGQILKVLGIRLERMARRLARRNGRAAYSMDLHAIVVPDSRAALDSLALCRDASCPSLANHCLRTYFWGALLAQAGGVRYDTELFFVASMLHDLGLTERFAFRHRDCECFAIEGALAARTFAEEQGWPEERQAALAEAISRHLNVKVPVATGAEAHLVQAGAGADVHGGRMEEVLQRYPRLNFKKEIIPALKQQVERRPESRIAFLCSVGFADLIRSAPFSE